MAIYFLSPYGSDTAGTGSIIAPWRTLTKFYSVAGPGDRCYLRGGWYVGADITTPTINVSGAFDSPIVVARYPGEEPVLDGSQGGTYNDAFMFWNGASYHVVDGLTMQHFVPTTSGVIIVGGDDASHVSTGILLRNNRIWMEAGLSINEHGIYLSHYSDKVTVQRNKITGHDAAGAEGSAIECYHTPGTTNVVIEDNLVVNVAGGIQLWDTNINGDVRHNTIVNCYNELDLRFHGAITVRDNLLGPSNNLALYDPNNSISTTADHNTTEYALANFNPDWSVASGAALTAATDGGVVGWRGFAYAPRRLDADPQVAWHAPYRTPFG